jgi:hypothetical protein
MPALSVTERFEIRVQGQSLSPRYLLDIVKKGRASLLTVFIAPTLSYSTPVKYVRALAAQVVHTIGSSNPMGDWSQTGNSLSEIHRCEAAGVERLSPRCYAVFGPFDAAGI